MLLGCRSPGHDGSWVLQVFHVGNELQNWAVQIDFFVELRHPDMQAPLLCMVGDMLRSNWARPEPHLATFRIVGRKDAWHQIGAAILLKSISCPLIYMKYRHRDEEWMAFNCWKFSSGKNELLHHAPPQQA